jgi:hypothetical protein
MPHNISLSGKDGVIKWGYVQVASVDTWSIEVDATGGELTGVVGSPHNEFAASQQPVRFVVPRDSVTWEWPILTLQITDGRVNARLGPFKE